MLALQIFLRINIKITQGGKKTCHELISDDGV